MRRMNFAVYNLAPAGDPNRGPEFVARELNAIANNRPRRLRRRPKVIGTMEAVGRRMPQLDHYRMVRDTSTPARANLCLYVLRRLHLGDRRWVDLKLTWPRVLHAGTHPPRSILIQHVEGWRVVLSHAPQGVRTLFRDEVRDGLLAARHEWVEAIVEVLQESRMPTLLLTDPNGLQLVLRRRVPDLVVTGTAVEAAHARRAVFTGSWLPRRINGVPMLSDHGRALLGRARRRA